MVCRPIPKTCRLVPRISVFIIHRVSCYRTISSSSSSNHLLHLLVSIVYLSYWHKIDLPPLSLVSCPSPAIYSRNGKLLYQHTSSVPWIKYKLLINLQRLPLSILFVQLSMIIPQLPIVLISILLCCRIRNEVADSGL